jgi:DNA mismatch repair protein MutS|tara:strand:- start:1902 stop:4967 length:3066 start_codon:yes stop_codon:yes gene_type:complete
MSLIRDYFDKTIEYKNIYGENTIVFMQVGAFYEVYGLREKSTGEIKGSNIVEFSSVCDLNIADKKICVDADGVIMAGFSHYMLDKYVKRMQEVGYTIAVFTQDEQMKNTTRSLSGIYSPGTYLSQETTTNISNNTVCVWLYVNEYTLDGKVARNGEKTIHIGISNIDIYTGKTTIYEYHEQYLKNPTTFDDLERFLSIYQPSELILLGNLPDTELDSIIQYCSIQCSAIHKVILLSDSNNNIEQTQKQNNNVQKAINCQKQTYQLNILQQFYTDPNFDIFYQYSIACQSFCYLLDFVYQHNPNLVHKIYLPVVENCSERLSLANHSLKQLNMIDDESYKGRLSSVLHFLNHCVTPMGRRRFSHDLLNPTTKIENLNDEYCMTDYLLSNYNLYEPLKPKLSQLKDISKLYRQIVLKKLPPSSIYQIYEGLKIIKEVRSMFQHNIEITQYIDKKQGDNQISMLCQEIIVFIEARLQLNKCKEIHTLQGFDDNFFVQGVNPELDNKTELLFDSMDKLEAIKNMFNEIISKYEKNSKTTEYVKIHETEKNNVRLLTTKRRSVLLKQALDPKKSLNSKYTNGKNQQNTVSLSYTSSLTNEKKTFLFNIDKENVICSSHTTQNDAIYTEEIEEICKNISIIKNSLKDDITRCFQDFLTEMIQFHESLDKIVEYITLIDMIFTKAYIAKKYHYCKPTIQEESDHSFVQVEGLRHCLIEHLQQDEIYVSNDISLDEKSKGILLYGTNAVGKTSFIRAIGISVIMAQAGMYVPCLSFHYHPYRQIFTRIIGNDNIFKGLSTFAVEMSELRTILKMADKYSLVLGDELCSGTESISAVSIFVAGIKQLYERKCTFIFATHLHEIVHYDEIEEMEKVHLKHMTVVYDQERDVLVYDRKLKNGAGENMYGLEVCKSLNLPRDFLDLAHEIRNKYHPENQSILSLTGSHFNSKKIMGMCEMCNKEVGSDVHHMQYQKDADSDGFILESERKEVFHKNHLANLMTLCEKCHNELHRTNKKIKRVKTNKGIMISVL